MEPSNRHPSGRFKPLHHRIHRTPAAAHEHYRRELARLTGDPDPRPAGPTGPGLDGHDLAEDPITGDEPENQDPDE